MNTKRMFLSLLVLLLLVGGLWWWLGRNKSLIDYIPARSKAVVRLSVEAQRSSELLSRVSVLTHLPINSADVEGASYFFVTPNEYFGFIADIRSEAARDASWNAIAFDEADGVRWLWSDAGWLGALQGSRLMILGPGTVAERERLRHTLQVMMDAAADEGFGHSAKADVLQADAPASFYTSASVMPAPYGTLLRLALPESAKEIAGVVTTSSAQTQITGSMWREGMTWGEVSVPTPELPFTSPQLLQAHLHLSGSAFLKRLRSDGSMRMWLTALSDSSTQTHTIATMRDDLRLTIAQIDTTAGAQYCIEGVGENSLHLKVESAHFKGDTSVELPAQKDYPTSVLINLSALRAMSMPEGLRQLVNLLLPQAGHVYIQTNERGDFVVRFLDQ